MLRPVFHLLSKHQTKRLPVVDVIHVAASPSDGTSPIGIEVLARQLYSLLTSPLAPPTNTDEATVPVEDVTPWSKRIDRCCPGTVILAVDHAFPIRGHGTILTGTVRNTKLPAGKRNRKISTHSLSTRKTTAENGGVCWLGSQRNGPCGKRVGDPFDLEALHTESQDDPKLP